MIERERKFLVNNDYKYLGLYKSQAVLIKQAYLLIDDSHYLRVRLKGGKAYFCYKYIVSTNEKEEFEYEIPIDDGIKLYEYSNWKLEKLRFSKKLANKVILDIDFYNNGLVTAEIEYSCSEVRMKSYLDNDVLKLNSLLLEEITNNRKYSNIKLAQTLN